MIRFNAKTEIRISNDLVNDVLALHNEEKFGNLGILVDNNVVKNKDIQDLISELESLTEIFPLFFKTIEPTTSLVDEITAHYRQKKINFFIGIGGGSIIDLTKAVSAMVVNPGSVEDYHGTGKSISTAVKKIIIPTTAGTGSEVTPGAVLLNEKTSFKRGLNSPLLSPEVAILNPSLTTTMPDSVTASTGMDALGHAIESYTSKNSNIITRMYSRQAFSLIFNNLNRVFNNRNNLSIRGQIQLGACLAGYAIYNSNTGAGHSLAYPLGIYHKIPHGLAVALIIPHVIQINIEKGCYIYSDLYDCIDSSDKNIHCPKEKSERFCEFILKNSAFKFLPKGLRDFGINETNYEFLAERGLDLKTSLFNNPVEFNIANAKDILLKILSDEDYVKGSLQ